MGGSRGEQGVQTPMKNHKNVWFHSYTGPDPLKNHKATKPAFYVGPSSTKKNTHKKTLIGYAALGRALNRALVSLVILIQ